MASDYQAEDVLTITGEDLEDCRAKLIDMYGSAYNIISRRQVLKKCGPFGLLKKEYVEVKYVKRRADYDDSLIDVSDPESLRRTKDEILRMVSGGKSKEELQLAELNSKLDNLTSQIQNIPKGGDEKERIESVERIREMLDENEFSKEFINEIALRLEKEFSFEDLKDFAKVERQVVDWIGESISIAPKKAHRPPHVIVIVGSTGVGKTTTIAKLAAQHIILEKDNSPKMCMITVDTTRVGAEEQLKKLGGVLSLNVLKVENADDLKTVFDSIRDDYDIIYIDTSGYSPNDSENIAKLKTTLSVENLRPDIFLAVTASTKLRDLRNIVQNYEPFGYSSVIVTKCDETTRFGNIISVFHEKGKSLAYITDGQKVARNIKKASAVDFLIRLYGFTIDRIHVEEIFGGEENGRSD